MWEKRLALYDTFIESCPKIERLGKTMPYTSVNGYMFSLLNKAGEIGIRFSKSTQGNYFNTYNTTYYKSYGAIMKGYILITEEMLSNKELIISLLNESHEYFNGIESNKHKKNDVILHKKDYII